MKPETGPLFEAVYSDAEGKRPKRLVDVMVSVAGRRFAMLAPGGPEREKALIENIAPEQWRDSLPVLLGAGMGHALHLLLEKSDGPIAVVEKELSLQQVTGVLARAA